LTGKVWFDGGRGWVEGQHCLVKSVILIAKIENFAIMEKITISNFLNIKYLELTLSKINIVIGPQANGKSVLAKLVYFFKFFLLLYRFSIKNQSTKSELDKAAIRRFEIIFPPYAWERQDFSITYQFGEYNINLITTTTLLTGKHEITLNYSEDLLTIREKLRTEYQKKLSLYDDTIDNKENKCLRDILSEYVFSNSNQKKDFDRLIFIPAGRSFFANLEKNVFSFLSGDIPIDYFLKEFGSAYESAKSFYNTKIFSKENSIVNELVNQIIVGDYAYENGQDWIYTNSKRKINLSDASSGQQEALPMAIILSIFPFFSANHLFLIEEPEAHLFPNSQKSIVTLIGLIFNLTQKRHSFFITTHSPYILTALNNLIQAKNVRDALETKAKDEGKKVDYDRLFSIVPDNQMIDIDDVAAYTLQDGELQNIINPENKIIDTNIIDEVSNQFSQTFEQLLDLEYGE
jgi:predicted ATPase